LFPNALKDFLTEDGAIFVSIDDNEVQHLRSIMDEVFGAKNHVATLIWKRRQTPDSRNVNGVSVDHEYVIVFGKGNVRFKGQAKDLTKYSNPNNDPNGPWMSDNLTGLADATERPNLHYEVVHPVTGRRYPPHSARGWICGPAKMQEYIAEGRILWPKSATGRPRLKRFMSDMKSDTTGFSSFLQAQANVAGTKEQRELFGDKVFAFPKPSDLITTLVEQNTDKDSLILDSFAGSGTTGHAVLMLNQADGGKRRFILVEMDEDICRNVTAKRLTRVIDGYGETPGLGGGYRFCTLGEPLFDEMGQTRAGIAFPDLAAHIFFTETGSPIPKRATGKTPLLGVHDSKAVYLLYNGVLDDKRPNSGNVLTGEVLRELPENDGPRVVYGSGCRLGEARLRRCGVVFKQIPYQIQVS
jgi:adenine-specific DNA-methyltransferase